MIRNYFADLELNFSADAAEIRAAYKRLARRFHPDLNPEDIFAEELFRKVHEAYTFLSDETRASRLRSRLKVEMGAATEKSGKWKLSRILPKSVSRFVTEWKEEKTGRSKSKRAEILQHDISIQVREADIRNGFEKSLQFEIDKPCPSCRHANRRAGSIAETCKRCAGLGFKSIQRGRMQWKKVCDDCRGQGFIRRSRCSTCKGAAKIRVAERAQLVWQGSRHPIRTVILKNFGHYSYDGKRRGDLWVHLELK